MMVDENMEENTPFITSPKYKLEFALLKNVFLFFKKKLHNTVGQYNIDRQRLKNTLGFLCHYLEFEGIWKEPTHDSPYPVPNKMYGKDAQDKISSQNVLQKIIQRLEKICSTGGGQQTIMMQQLVIAHYSWLSAL